jgi:hypothetical protein
MGYHEGFAGGGSGKRHRALWRIGRMRCRILIAAMLLAALALMLASPGRAAEPPLDFGRQIRPILANNCLACHGPDAAERKAGLRLDQREAALAAAESGEKAIVPGKPDASELVRRIYATDADLRMPPAETKKTLSADEKALLARWIAEGAKYDLHWSFVAPQRPPLSEVKYAAWPRNPIDRFILARLEREGLSSAPEAPRHTLIRRLTLDLTGFPPTLDEIDAFEADTRPDAYERLADRLLASPLYGERMAVDWLDAARFADTHGYHIDSGRDMTRWREYVIESFNRNTPYDQFTVEQLAGDLLPATGDPERDLRQKLASGFNRNHMINFEGGAIPEEYLNAYIVDRVNTTGTVFLGLTVACTQCHDHKYDPLTQREFYQLYAFFNNVPEVGLDGRKGNAVPLIRLPSDEQRQELERVTAEIAKLEPRIANPGPEIDAAQAQWEKSASSTEGQGGSLPEPVAKALAVAAESRTPEQQSEIRKHYREQVSPPLKALKAELAALKMRRETLEAQIPTSMVMEEAREPRETFLLVRGAYDKKGDKVTAEVPSFLPPLAEGDPANRLGLARWLVDPNHPLTARVTVNRYWQLLFGTGIVKTAEDFGTQGELPSHPELLDWLAVEFKELGTGDREQGTGEAWNVKRLVRRMISSAAYRQSSAVTESLVAKDPENRLLARGPRFRLQAEFIRDQALFVSGLYDRRIGGKSVSPYQPAGLWEELMSRADGANWTAQTYVQDHGADLYRRTMYTFWKRTCPPATLATLDAPDRETCTVRRSRTNTPLQALVLMNDPTYVEAARKFAERILHNGGRTASERLTFAFESVTSRPPTAAELAVLARLLDRQLKAFQADPEAVTKLLATGESPADESLNAAELAAWTMVASAILNTDEALTKG